MSFKGCLDTQLLVTFKSKKKSLKLKSLSGTDKRKITLVKKSKLEKSEKKIVFLFNSSKQTY